MVTGGRVTCWGGSAVTFSFAAQWLCVVSSAGGIQSRGPEPVALPLEITPPTLKANVVLFSFSFPLCLLLTLLQMSPFPHPPLLSSTHPLHPLPSGPYYTVVCGCELCVCVLWLIPSPLFSHLCPFIFPFHQKEDKWITQLMLENV